MSQEDAAKQTTIQNVRYDVIPIEPIYEATLQQLEPIFEGRGTDVTAVSYKHLRAHETDF